MAAEATVPAPRRSAGKRLADLFQGRPRLTVAALLAAPLGWLVIGYLGSLGVMLVASFWHLNELSGEVQQGFTLDNYNVIFTDDVYRTIALRTIGIAALVTVTDAILAFPIAFYMAKVAKPRMRSLLVVAVLLPLWSSYLVKVGAWRLMLAENGAINWALEPFGLHGPGFGTTAVWLVMAYIWLPYMILPTQAALERVPANLVEASADLGANPSQTFRTVLLPLALPGIVAGDLMAFTLSIDDFVITFFVAGVGVSTLPLQIYSMIKVAVTPEINAVSTLLMGLTLTLIGLASRFAPEALRGKS